MIAKKIVSAALAAAFVVSAGTAATAATRDEIAAISVSKEGDFKYWTKNSAVTKQLVEYVKDVTDPNSQNFIPVKDRIAVFDCDGTLMCETAPFYFDWMFPLYRVMQDPNYEASPAEITAAKKYADAIAKKAVTDDIDDEKVSWFPYTMAGMTVEEYRDYLKQYIENTNVQGLTNLKTGEAFYLPMVEVVSYLNANDFKVYIVSGCEREALRTLMDGIMDIEPEHIIGTDHSYYFANQGFERSDRYFFKKGDKLLRGPEALDVNVKGTKIFKIQREIGKKPVLAFGNSMGDASMFEYTISDNKYKSAAFVLLCDDTKRELGDPAKAANMLKTAKEYGWTPVSMQKDFATIYGDNVKREK